MKIGQSAAKLRIGERSTTIPYGSRIASDWQFEMVNPLFYKGEDIVYSHMKVWGSLLRPS